MKFLQDPMKISIVDTSAVLAGSTAVEAFRTTVELPQLAARTMWRMSEASAQIG
jgi:hypothetical protein